MCLNGSTGRHEGRISAIMEDVIEGNKIDWLLI